MSRQNDDSPRFSRRQLLCSSALLALTPLSQAGVVTSTDSMAAAWMRESSLYVGIIRLPHNQQAVEVVVSEAIPTRAHGMAALRDGSLVFASRRPGDWLLRIRAHAPAQWVWIEPDRAFNGHVIESANGQHLYTTETNLEDNQGLIGVRDATTLEKIAEWPTGGMDPHQLLLDAQGQLLVANGGIPTQPETGRRKLRLSHMDSSIALLAPQQQGAIARQWKLDDPRLSLRHLAWGPRVAWSPQQRWLGIALQAEHELDSQRASAPVIAMLDGESLQVATLPAGLELAGYGGDIGSDGHYFAVSCPRASSLTWWEPPSQRDTPISYLHQQALEGVYCVSNRSPSHAIEMPRPDLWVGTHQDAALLQGAGKQILSKAPLQGLALDNHWIPLPRGFGRFPI